MQNVSFSTASLEAPASDESEDIAEDVQPFQSDISPRFVIIADHVAFSASASLGSSERRLRRSQRSHL